MSLIQSSNRRKAIKKYLVVAILSALLVHFGSTPVNKQPQQSANTQVVAAVAKPSAPIQTSEVQPEKEAAVVVEATVPEPTITPQPPLTDHEHLMQAAGIQQSDWPAVEYIIMHESSWRPDALNSEGCVGLGQRCPASVLYTECPDLSPVCQLRHFNNYAVSRYGGWQSAYNAWTGQHWW